MLTLAALLRLKGTVQSVDIAIGVADSARQLYSGRDRKAAAYAGILGKLYSDRYRGGGDMSDLDLSIRVLQEGCGRSFPGTADHASLCDALSFSFRIRFSKTGVPRDINSSIALLLELMNDRSGNWPRLPSIPSALARSYVERYQDVHRDQDVRSAMIYATRDWETNKDRAALLNLGEVYYAMFERNPTRINFLRTSIRFLLRPYMPYPLSKDDERDLEIAVDQALADTREAVNENLALGRALLACQKVGRKAEPSCPSDWQPALEFLKRANEQAGPVHQRWREGAWRRADALISRGTAYGVPEDLEQARSILEPCVRQVAGGDKWWTKCAISFAKCLAELSSPNLDAPISRSSAGWLEKAACNPAGTVSDRFSAACGWGETAARIGDEEKALRAFKQAVALLPKIGAPSLELELRIQEIGRKGTVVNDAASFAVKLGKFEEALEILGKGRLMISNETIGLDRAAGQLSKQRPDLASRLSDTSQRTSGLLAHPSGNRTEVAIQDQQAISAELQELLIDVRQVQGFENFLCSPHPSSLRTAAKEGPIVVINASRFGCDVLIVTNDYSVRSFPLVDCTIETAFDLARETEAALQKSKDLSTSSIWEDRLAVLLSRLWTLVSSTVVRELRNLYPQNFPGRIWLYPTGPFTLLPFHLAFSDDGEESLLQLAVCSYLPRLSSICDLVHNGGSILSSDAVFLLVGNDNAEGRTPLPFVEQEFQIIELKRREEEGQIIKLIGTDANLERVCEELQRSTWIHFSSHVYVSPDDPFDSRVFLSDHPLTVRKLLQMDFTHCRFAFLACCRSASPTPRFIEESVSVGAVLHMLGVPSVIGTLLPIPDQAMPEIAAKFYDKFGTKGSEEPMSAAQAIREVVLEMREEGLPMAGWVPLVHIGL